MTNRQPSIEWLSDVSVFRVNRLDAHSDHKYYETMEEALAGGDMPLRHSLNGDWKFSYAANVASRCETFYKKEFDCSGWADIRVPGHIQLQGWGKPQYVNTMYPWDGLDGVRPPNIPQRDNAVGSYVKSFRVPANMKDKPVFLSFQGVESAFFVWLNGEFVGYSEDSFTPSEFDLTPYIGDGENKLSVEVYQRSTGSWLEDQDFWRFSGIFRDVYLYTVPECHVQDLRVRAELDDSYAQGTLKVDLKLSESSAAEGATARIELADAQGRIVLSETGSFVGGVLSVVSEAGKVILWSAESPYLYSVRISILSAERRVVEAIVQKTGFRRFELKDKLMRLNGERIVFKGVNRHEFNCRSGRNITREDMLWDIKTLKRNNINAVRTSHYPNQTLWYELCDEYGVYVIDEMNLESHGSWQKMGAVEPSWNVPGDKPEWQDIVMDRARSMLERDKNHASILIWSCGNESYAGEVILNVSNYFRETDPSRLVHYEGVFHNREFDRASDMESRMYAKPADIEAYLRANPDKPYISCEYMHAMGNSVGGLHKYTELENKYDQYQGGFIWDYIDQSLIKEDRYGKEYLAYGGDYEDRPTDYSFCGNGIVFADRRETPKMQEVKFLYQNFELTPSREAIAVRNGNLFEGTDGLRLAYRLLKDGTEVYAGVTDVDVAPGGETAVQIRLPDTDGVAGEYCVQASLTLKEATLWAEEGHEVAFGEAVYLEEARAGSVCDAVADAPGGRLTVVVGDVNIGVTGDGFAVQFSKQVGSLTSLRYGSREMIAVPPMPNFWRAQTDNDKGYNHVNTAGVWLAASVGRRCLKTEMREEQGSVSVSFEYAFGAVPGVGVTVAYTVTADGSIRVRTDYRGAAGLPDVPIVALTFKTSADYDQSEWYARGPEENYSDRSRGARLTTFRKSVAELPSKYLVPQESGNRTGVRRVGLTNKTGVGIRIQADPGAPVECNLSPYTAFELENAAHSWELPAVHYTVVTVAGKQMGVGGDDSWGAPVHEEYRIRADRDMTFAFTLSSIG
ncbi:glycoside hydrolase family 2 TIM barrel-domain containing protein [Cohnella sp. GCM10027633]|uniref:glycoside hydrolase family 2 TIM barrel-domain containing protein n=1 Tax=unclassified Cohnella TaxID=2636738 RepID=UPI00363DAC25